jgi:hypothetical protein
VADLLAIGEVDRVVAREAVGVVRRKARPGSRERGAHRPDRLRRGPRQAGEVRGQILDLGIVELGGDRVHQRVGALAFPESLELGDQIVGLLRREIGNIGGDADAGFAVAAGALGRHLAAGFGIGGKRRHRG